MWPQLGRHDALVVVDVQRDFCAGGALSVPDADSIVPVVNSWIDRAASGGAAVVASRDWHPPEHVSFATSGGPWPPHCVQGTPGAAFHPALSLPADCRIVSKGTAPDGDDYSALCDTDLVRGLKDRGVTRLWIAGVALDVCVRATALNAVSQGFDVHVISDATRAIRPESWHETLSALRDAGVTIYEGLPTRWTDHAASHSALLVDLYELTMAESYFLEGMAEAAVFELFFRALPERRHYVMAAGLDDALGCLERLRFTDDCLDYLRQLGLFHPEFLDYLRELRFTGDVYAVAEGTLVFPSEPLIEVVAPLIEAQLVETAVLNRVHFQSVIATKASRIRDAAGARTVVDFGARRAPGGDAAVQVARAAYLAGLDGTSNVLAARRYGIPPVGTMAHSYVQAHQNEQQAFDSFARNNPRATLLVDTYDVVEGTRHAIELCRALDSPQAVGAVRLDSGDVGLLAFAVRQMLDQAGLDHIRIFASGGLDEYRISELAAAGAPIDGFGVGTSLATSDDAPALDMVYKLVEYAGRPCFKWSEGKETLGGRKQVFRRLTRGKMVGDVIGLASDESSDLPLLEPVMRGGRRCAAGRVALGQARRHATDQLAMLPDGLHFGGSPTAVYPVRLSEALHTQQVHLREEPAQQDEAIMQL